MSDCQFSATGLNVQAMSISDTKLEPDHLSGEMADQKNNLSWKVNTPPIKSRIISP